MVDVLVSSDELTILGGPSSIDVNVGVGQQGNRGTYIFTGFGKPTDPGMQFRDNYDDSSTELRLKDLFINLKPSDDEYLYLYQYEPTATGASQWVKTLRLVPNTALANVPVIFYNGQAVTFKSTQGLNTTQTQLLLSSIDLSIIIPSPTPPPTHPDGTLWLDLSTTPWVLKQYSDLASGWISLGTVTVGLYFPLGSYFPLAELGTLSSTAFNIQYDILNDKPVSSAITVGEITEVGTDVLLPVYVNAIEATVNPLNGAVTWGSLTGIQTVHLFMTYGIGD